MAPSEIPVFDTGCCATALRKASRRVSQFYDDALSETGLRGTQYSILSHLYRHGRDAPTVVELAASLVLDRSALGHNLRPLERAGLVALLEDEDDRRKRLVVMTSHGKAKFREARLLWQKAQDRFVEVYGAEESDALRGKLLAIAYDDRLGALAG